MNELTGGIMMVLGGLMLAGSGLAQLRHGLRSAVRRARSLFGDSDAAVCRRVPAELTSLIARLD